MRIFHAFWRRHAMAALMAVSVGITGCASTGSSMLGGAQLDPRLTESNDAEFFSKSGYQACAGAAALGVAACLIGASGSDKLTCAVIAGVAACGIAMGTNYYLDYRRSQYKSTGAMLDAVTKDVEQDTQKLQQRSQTLQAVIESDKQKLAQLRREVAQGKLSQADAQKQLRNVDADIAKIKEEQDKIDDRIAAYREASASSKDGSRADIRKLDAQIGKLQAEATKLRKAMSTLTAQRDSLDWGKSV